MVALCYRHTYAATRRRGKKSLETRWKQASTRRAEEMQREAETASERLSRCPRLGQKNEERQSLPDSSANSTAPQAPGKRRSNGGATLACSQKGGAEKMSKKPNHGELPVAPPSGGSRVALKSSHAIKKSSSESRGAPDASTLSESPPS